VELIAIQLLRDGSFKVAIKIYLKVNILLHASPSFVFNSISLPWALSSPVPCPVGFRADLSFSIIGFNHYLT
jgi:hypothetical protein